MPGASRIDDYVAALGRRLRGPRRLKRDLLAEARDGLADAAEALRADGLDRDEAERIAVAEFGDVAEIAPGYQAELAACQGRRTAALLFLSVPVTTLMWSALWRLHPWRPADPADIPAWFMPLAQGVDLVQAATGIAGALALLALGRAARRARRSRLLDPRVLTRGLGVLILVQMPLVALASTALSSAAATSIEALEQYPPAQAVTLISTLLGAWQLASALRCLHATSRTAADVAAERVAA
jgi:hypothetical protein